MLKKIKKILRKVIIIMLVVLAINVTYDIGTSFAAKQPKHTVQEINEMDRIRQISDENVERINGTEKKDTKLIRYASIIGILGLAVVMLIVITAKDESNNK